jgi:hypothetical protein
MQTSKPAFFKQIRRDTLNLVHQRAATMGTLVHVQHCIVNLKKWSVRGARLVIADFTLIFSITVLSYTTPTVQ